MPEENSPQPELDIDAIYPDNPDDDPFGPDDAKYLFCHDDISGKDSNIIEFEYRKSADYHLGDPARRMALPYYLMSRDRMAEARFEIDRALRTLDTTIEFCDKFIIPLANLALVTKQVNLAEKLLMEVPEAARGETPGWKQLYKILCGYRGQLSDFNPSHRPPLLLDPVRFARCASVMKN